MREWVTLWRCLSALTVAITMAACTPTPAPPTPQQPAPAASPVASATPRAMAAPQATPTPHASPTPGRMSPPAGTVALYGVGAPGESLDLYALAAGGSATALGMQVPWGSVASEDGRWLAHLDAALPEARSVIVENLQDRRRYTIPLGEACTGPMCIAGLWAFDREATRLASVEVTPDGWALVVVNLQDGSSRRFDPMQVQVGHPMGWAATGELLVSRFTPYSGGGHGGIWALRLPDGDGPTEARQLVGVGAYSAVALSPDGTRLLYLARDPGYTPAGYTALAGTYDDVAMNQLWSLDIASGTATKLVEVTDGGALEDTVAWSPDGREALFVQGHYDSTKVLASATLKAVDTTGIVRGIGPLAVRGYLGLYWCRPGLALATVYNQVSELYTVDLSTGQATSVARDAGSVLAVVRAQAGAEEAPAPAGSPSPCSSQPISLPEAARFNPVPDARGAIAVSTTGGGFSLVFPDTGHIADIHTLAPCCGQQVREPDHGLAWSPDGRRIAFVYSECVPPQEVESSYLMLADLERGELRPLLDDAGVYGRPAWSPDGRRLAYVRWQGRGVLSVLDVASGAVSEVAGDAIFTPWQAPAWIDDGHVAYVRGAGPNGLQAELVSQGPDDAAPEIIALGARVYAFSPDGTRVAYPWGNQLRLLDVASGAVESLGALDAGEGLQWSPDGRYLLAYGAPAGILLSQAGPAGPLELVAVGVPGAQVWSPDGKRFAYIAAGEAKGRSALAIYGVEAGAATTLGVNVPVPFEVAWSPR